ncbi:MAG: lauroyl acyltransferase [Rhodospirillaceae bacterium]|nr:lauroyl acyltransferase [Rhodospirillaceae bacterium]
MAKIKIKTKSVIRYIRYSLEALGALLLFSVFCTLPIKSASGLGCWIAQKVGPRLKINKRAKKNLLIAMPYLTEDETKKVIFEMWGNLGRVVGEMPHIRKIARWAKTGEIEIINREYLDQYCKKGEPVIYFSGHFANWELFALISREVGVPYAQVYRAANNPMVDFLLRRLRRLEDHDIIPKGPVGAKKLISFVRDGRRLGMLVDQKMNDGIEVPFFGVGAMTAPALAQIAIKYKCPAIPIKLERISACKFRVTVFSPISKPMTGNHRKDVELMMTEVNKLFEKWIIERPSQWLWLHRRWPES